MKKSTRVIFILSITVLVAYVACRNNKEVKQTVASVNTDSLVKRGDYLVTTMLCDDCHSPKRMGTNGPEVIPELRLSGFRQTAHLPKVDTTEIKKGWTLFNEDF